ncbi:MAG: lipid II flippase MurJ, partial [Planctomycetota bacterium]
MGSRQGGPSTLADGFTARCGQGNDKGFQTNCFADSDQQSIRVGPGYNVLPFLGEGAASASFIPIYSEALCEDRTRAARLANTVVTVLFVILAALLLAGEAGIWLYYKFFARTGETELILSLSSVMLPYMVFVCIVAIMAGVLNVHRHFASPAAAPIVLNIFIICTVVLTGWVFDLQAREQLFCVAVAVLVAGVVQVAMQVWPLRRVGVSIRPAWQVHSESFKKILLLMGPMI